MPKFTLPLNHTRRAASWRLTAAAVLQLATSSLLGGSDWIASNNESDQRTNIVSSTSSCANNKVVLENDDTYSASSTSALIVNVNNSIYRSLHKEDNASLNDNDINNEVLDNDDVVSTPAVRVVHQHLSLTLGIYVWANRRLHRTNRTSMSHQLPVQSRLDGIN